MSVPCCEVWHHMHHHLQKHSGSLLDSESHLLAVCWVAGFVFELRGQSALTWGVSQSDKIHVLLDCKGNFEFFSLDLTKTCLDHDSPRTSPQPSSSYSNATQRTREESSKCWTCGRKMASTHQKSFSRWWTWHLETLKKVRGFHFYRVLARLKRQGAVPCRFVRRPVVFPQRPVIFREPFGFFGLSSALFWAWSCRKHLIKAKGGAIFVQHVVIRVGHRRHLGFTSQIWAWEWGYANGIWRNVIFAIVYLESDAGNYEY